MSATSTSASGDPTPLSAPCAFERELETPAHIYYSHEGVSPAGLTQAEYRVRQLLQRERDPNPRDRTWRGLGPLRRP